MPSKNEPSSGRWMIDPLLGGQFVFVSPFEGGLFHAFVCLVEYHPTPRLLGAFVADDATLRKLR